MSLDLNSLQIGALFFRRYLFSTRAGAVIRSMSRISWLATLIGAFSLILVSSIMNGFNKTQSARLLNVEPHLLIKSSHDLSEIKSFLNQQDHVEVSQYSQNDVILRSLEGRFSGAIAKGASEEALYGFLNRAHKMRFKAGTQENISPATAELARNEIILGSDLARDLGVFEGDEIMIIPPETLLAPSGESIRYERMHVKSLFTTDFAEMDSRLILYSISDDPLKFQSDKSGERGLEVRFVNANDFELVVNSINNNFSKKIPYTLESWADRNRALFLALRLEKIAMLSLLSLSVLITCFSLITVITMLISQKKKDIQLLIAIGFSREKTERLFMGLGLALCMMGLFPGLILGVLVSLAVEKYPIDILPDIYYDSSIPSDVNYAFVFSVAVVCLLIAWITAKIPVTKAARHSVKTSFARTEIN